MATYLVYDESYAVIGVVSSERAATKNFPDQRITVVGPVPVDQPINWDETNEERYDTSKYKYADVPTADGVLAPPEGDSVNAMFEHIVLGRTRPELQPPASAGVLDV